MRRIPGALASLLAAAAVLSVAWTVLTAPLQGPDEDYHAAYVQHLAETGSGPQREPQAGRPTRSTEQAQLMRWEDLRPLIGIVGARPGWTQAEQRSWEAVAARMTASARSDDGANNPVAQNPPLYYGYEAVAYRLSLFSELPTRLLVMRLFNLPLYLLVVLFAWLAAGEVFGRRRWAQTVAAGSVALLPQLTYISGVVNPDIALTCIWSAFAYLALVAVRVGPSRRVLAGLGALAAASILTHGRGLAILGPLVATLAVVGWRALPRARAVLGGAAIALATTAAGVGLSLAYSQAHGGGSSIGDEAGATAGAGTVKGFLAYLWEFYLPRLQTMSPQQVRYGYHQAYIEGLGGTFGSLEIVYPVWVYDLLALLAGAGLILLVLTVTRHWELVRRNAARLVVLASIPLSMLALVHAAAYRNLQAPPFDPLIAGRYLLPLVVVFGLAVAFVCVSLPRATGRLLGAAVLSLLCVLSISGLGLTLARFYA